MSMLKDIRTPQTFSPAKSQPNIACMERSLITIERGLYIRIMYGLTHLLIDHIECVWKDKATAN